MERFREAEPPATKVTVWIEQVFRRDLGVGPDPFQSGPVDAGLGEGPPCEVAEMLAALVEGGGELVEGQGCPSEE